MDTNKWNDLHPQWSGRPPSNFKKENTTVSEGYLKLKSTPRVNNMFEVDDPNTDIWVNAASFTIKTKIAKLGYFMRRLLKQQTFQ